MVKECYSLADKWTSSSSSKTFKPAPSDISHWLASQSVVFLEKLQTAPPLPASSIETMGAVYSFAKSQNVELVSRFFKLGLRSKVESVYKPTAELLGKVGRMKFVRPLYRALELCNRELAVETFEKNKDFYHPICRALVEKDLFGEK
jgi:leukotriene-A4 hydrolase